MSSIGKISENYQTLEGTTEVVNNAIITLKRRCLFLKDKQQFAGYQVSHDVWKDAANNLGLFLEYVIDLHDEKKTPNYSIIPKRVIDKFKNQLNSGAPYLDKIRSIRKKLKKDSLTDEEFLMLDRIVTGLDKERGSLFKTLRTGRG